MYVFTSLQAAQNAGFRWYAFSESEQLHIVEIDRMHPSGRRIKSLAFARPDREEIQRLKPELQVT